MGTITANGSTSWELNEPVRWKVQAGELVLMIIVGAGVEHGIIHIRMTAAEAEHFTAALTDGCTELRGRNGS